MEYVPLTAIQHLFSLTFIINRYSHVLLQTYRMVCWLCLVGSAVALLVIYKLVDTLLRRPRVSQLTDRYILVTGCDTGFGHGIAKRLDALGCHVFAGCLTQKGQNELRESCSDRVVTLLLDISDPDSVRKAFDFVKNQLPADQGHPIIIVISNMVKPSEMPGSLALTGHRIHIKHAATCIHKVYSKTAEIYNKSNKTIGKNQKVIEQHSYQ